MHTARNITLMELEHRSAETDTLRDREARERNILHEKLQLLEDRLADANLSNEMYLSEQAGYQEYILQLHNEFHAATVDSPVDADHVLDELRLRAHSLDSSFPELFNDRRSSLTMDPTPSVFNGGQPTVLAPDVSYSIDQRTCGTTQRC